MNSTTNPLTLPTQEPRRRKTLNIRMTEQERASVDRLAAKQGATSSALARHFLLQAVAFYNHKMQVEEVRDDRVDW